METVPAHRPLTGIRVLDLSRYLPGPFCALQLSWLGAAVTCIEQPPSGDPLRAMAPRGEDGISFAYRSLRRDAHVEVVDLRSPEGLEQVSALADQADVLIEGFRPGVTRRLGLGPEEVRARNPRLIYCSISGYGQDGPWAQAPGHDLNYQSVAGLLDQNGTSAEPVPSGVPHADLAGGLSAATAICAALVRRSATGVGCTIDIALSEAALALQSMQLPGPDAPRGTGMLTGGLASYRPYQCADGRWLAVAAIEPKFFSLLCQVIGRPELESMQHDVAEQERLHDELDAMFRTRTADEWTALLVGADGGGSCVTVVDRPAMVGDHPQLAARGAVRRLPGSSVALVPAAPYVLDGVRSDDIP